jgi:hypothetical protein
MHPLLRKALPHLAALGIFLALSAIFFYPQLDGKKIRQGDIQQYRGMAEEVRAFKEKTGETSLWTNAMFGGMPTYQINTITAGNQLSWLDRIGRLGIDRPIGRFFWGMTCCYIMLVVLGLSPWTAILGAIGFGFATNNFVLFEAGHVTKVRAIFYLPIIIAGLLLAFRKKYLLGGLLFALGFGLCIWANHVQMTYYFFLTVLLFGIAQLVEVARKGAWPHLGRALGILVLGALLAVGSSASNLIVTAEYAEDTMRGQPILEPEGQPDPGNSSETEGLAWEYAMQWSNGLIDLIATFIPGAAGGGSQERVGEDSAIVKDLRRKGASNLPRPFMAPLYWGKLPFTSGPAYVGALVFLFFLLGAILVKGPEKWWLLLGTLLLFLLSLGKHFKGLNRFLFEYMPLYSKFRAPSSILSIAPALMVPLGLLGLHQIASGKASHKEALRALYIAGGTLAAIAAVFWLIGPSLFEFSNLGDARYVQAGFDAGAILEDRQAMMRRDALRALALVLLGSALIWAFIQQKASRAILLGGLGILLLFDVFTVGRRYLTEENFTAKRQVERPFPMRPVDEQILRDKTPNYRVLDLSINTFNSAQASFYHKTIGGYHAAKLQRYQDIIDRHISRNNQRVLNMLNTRYIISGQPGQEQVQANPDALGNAWFVDDIRPVQTPNEEINALNEIDPARTAVVRTPEFGEYVQGFDPRPNGKIELTEYAPNHLKYQSNSSSEQLAVFSEIWYGPGKGWQAYLDGEPVDHIRVNYILRAMRVPAGQHEIEFVFAPRSFVLGRTLSWISSSLLLLALGTYIVLHVRKKARETPPAEEKPKPRKAATQPKARRTEKKAPGKKRKRRRK